MLDPVIREIGGFTYEIRQMSALPAWPVFLRVKAVVGQAVMAGLAATTVDDDFTIGNMAAGLMAGFAELKPEDMDAVILPMLGKVTVDGKQLTREFVQVHFAGGYGRLFRLLAVCVEVNFADFFGELRVELSNLVLLAGLKRAANQPSPPAESGATAA